MALPEAYQERVNQRADLAALKSVQFLASAALQELNKFNLISLVRRPRDNDLVLRELVGSGFEGTLVCEKPISTTPASGNALFNDVIAPWLTNGVQGVRRFGTPFLFIHMDWFHRALAALEQGHQVHLTWHHFMPPTLASWKSETAKGGGDISFYAIHLLAILVHTKVALRSDDSVKIENNGGLWRFRMGHFSVEFSSHLSPQFCLDIDGELTMTSPSPFGAAPRAGELDPRVTPLTAFYKILSEPQNTLETISFHKDVLDLWCRAQAFSESMS